MRKVAVGLAIVGFSTVSAFGGTVEFTPVGSASVLAGETVTFDVAITATDFASFTSVGIIIGSDRLTVDSFTLSDDWMNAFDIETADLPANPAVYLSDVSIAGLTLFGTVSAPILVGQLVVGTTGLALGVYEVVVDPTRDLDLSGDSRSAVRSGSTREALSGIGVVTVVPEPATLVLLGIGGLAALRRRKA